MRVTGTYLAWHILLLRRRLFVYVTVHVSFQVAGLRIFALTHITDERPFSGVQAHVHFQITGRRESTLTLAALVRSFTAMNTRVTLQLRRTYESLTANITLVRLDVRVRAHVRLQMFTPTKRALTGPADKRPWTGVDTHVFFQTPGFGKLLLTNATHKRPIADIVVRFLLHNRQVDLYSFSRTMSTDTVCCTGTTSISGKWNDLNEFTSRGLASHMDLSTVGLSCVTGDRVGWHNSATNRILWYHTDRSYKKQTYRPAILAHNFTTEYGPYTVYVINSSVKSHI